MVVAASAIRSIALLAIVLIAAGAGWIVFISLISALVQTLAPDWARARVLAVFILVFQGGSAGPLGGFRGAPGVGPSCAGA